MADQHDEDSIEQYEDLKRGDEMENLSAAERFHKTTHIALLMAYDLIDKMRYAEKLVDGLDEDEIKRRQVHMTKFIDQLHGAYETFTELEP